MGRHYWGDIEGKFWFAVQPSDAADRFGVKGVVPQTIQYHFGSEDLEKVEAELDRIREGLGENFDKLKKFFEEHPYYSEDEVAEFVGETDIKKVKTMLKAFADYDLGLKISNCIIEFGVCDFEGEL